MKLSELSGDSSVREIQWKGGSVSFIFEDNESDKTFLIEIETQRLFSEKTEEMGSVHLILESAETYLPIEQKSKIYIMPAGFNKQMELNRIGLHVMIGLNSLDFPYILRAVGYKQLLVCPVKNEESIKMREV